MQKGTSDTASLTPERIRRLEEIGFEWSVRSAKQSQWDTHYDNLVEFVVRMMQKVCFKCSFTAASP